MEKDTGSHHINPKLILFPVLLLLIILLTLAEAGESFPDSAFILVSGIPETAKQNGLNYIGYENAGVLLSDFTDIEYVTIEEADKRLDALDPRRTPFINALADYFKDGQEGKSVSIIPNTSESRKVIAETGAEVLYPQASQILLQFSPSLLTAVVGMLLVIPLLITWKKNKPADILQIFPWIGILLSPVLNLLLIVNALISYYAGHLYLDDMRNPFITGKKQKLLHLLVLCYCTVLFMFTASSAYQFAVPLLLALYPVFSLELEKKIMKLISERRFHPVFSPVQILPRGFSQEKAPWKMRYLSFSLLFAAALGGYSCTDTASPGLPEIVKPGELTVDKMLSNAAFQTGYLYNYGYDELHNRTSVLLPSYFEEDGMVSFQKVAVKEFTDDWYKDIIATTQPLLLAFLEAGNPAEKETSVDYIYLYLPFTVLPAILIFLRNHILRAYKRNNGLSEIISNP